MTAIFHPEDLAFRSFLLNHSPAFNVALAAAVFEYAVEALLCPALKLRPWTVCVGFAICVFGQSLRSLAMFTAGANFTHVIAVDKKDEHVLVTNGIYRVSRHPGYAGWYWWALGGQILLGNPICVVAYAVVAWRFFASRVHYEEAKLFEFFGEQYSAYHSRVGTLIPFLSTPNRLGQPSAAVRSHF